MSNFVRAITMIACLVCASGSTYASLKLPKTIKVDPAALTSEPLCDPRIPSAWRDAQVIDGVEIAADLSCSPDNPAWIAAAVKGTNNVSMDTLMKTYLSPDAIIKTDDLDGDGDPDRIIIKLEVMELNGKSPDFPGLIPTFDIAPGVQPGAWVFSPKTSGMSTENFESVRAMPLIRLPSPVIRVEQGDIVQIVLENTHYLPHSLHLHGVDHPFHQELVGNDGVPQTSEMELMPGERRVYQFQAREPGTMFYHCHVQTHTHLSMGLGGIIVVEENRPNNWLQTLNIGGGFVRHSSVAVKESFDREYDLHYHSMHKELGDIIKKYNDPRLIARDMNRRFKINNSTEDYFTINGLSYPYSLRESLIIVEPDETIKLRLLNSGDDSIAIHTHGHHAKITHYDGAEHNPIAQITRDVFDIAPAQRIDIKLETVNDGRRSYGEGDWLIHDHREKGITTDGMAEGGSMSSIVYTSYLGENGLPNSSHFGVSLDKFFTKEYWERRVPIWQDLDAAATFGAADSRMINLDTATRNSLFYALSGLLIGLLLYVTFAGRKHIKQCTTAVISKIRSKKGGEA
jgi:hypothetical protein